MGRARSNERGQVFFVACERLCTNEGIFDHVQVKPCSGVVGPIMLVGQGSVNPVQDWEKRVARIEEETLSRESPIDRLGANAFGKKAALAHLAEQNNVGFFGLLDQLALPK